jgi:hypothetical protein
MLIIKIKFKEMKKTIKNSGKLLLQKKTITNLKKAEMDKLLGGTGPYAMAAMASVIIAKDCLTIRTLIATCP